MRQDAVDLIVALKGYTLPKQAEYAHHRLCKAIAEKKWHGLTDEDKQIAFDDSQGVPRDHDAGWREVPWSVDRRPRL